MKTPLAVVTLPQYHRDIILYHNRRHHLLPDEIQSRPMSAGQDCYDHDSARQKCEETDDCGGIVPAARTHTEILARSTSRMPSAMARGGRCAWALPIQRREDMGRLARSSTGVVRRCARGAHTAGSAQERALVPFEQLWTPWQCADYGVHPDVSTFQQLCHTNEQTLNTTSV